MKKYFITGLVILLPLALTLSIVTFFFNFLTGPFLGIVKTVFEHYNLFEEGFLFLTAPQIQSLIAKILILASLFFIVVGLGFLARWFFFKTLIKLADYLVKKIPLVSAVYKTCQEVIKTLFTSNTQSFKQVVLVRFPQPNSYSIGLVTAETIASLKGTPHCDAVAVFVPTTPNPTSGYLVMFHPSDIVYLDMKVEEAFKYIISCGVISPDFKVVSKEQTPKSLQSQDHSIATLATLNHEKTL